MFTNPGSPFVQQAVALQTEPQRRQTLIGRRFATTYPDGSTELRELTSNELTDVLRNTFGIALEAEETEFLKQRSRLGDEASKYRSERARSM